jgi:histidinol-phosphatase (PHP family)
MFDTHMHTEVSSDSKMKIEDAIRTANELNDLGIILTEHMDLNFPVPNEFIFDVNNYFEKYDKYRSNKVLLGIEVGLRFDCVKENAEIAEKNSFDYVIGSIHFIDNIDIFQKEYYANKTKKQAYDNYLNCMLENIKAYDCFDSLGHIDYISRYAYFEDKEIYYDEYRELIDEILKILIEKGKAIEINSRRLAERSAVINMIKIYKRYKELGGKIVTIGSDAHKTEDIGKNFKIAKEIADECNLKTVYFKNRKAEYL